MKSTTRKLRLSTRGFTLVELMVAVAVLAIMITIVASIVSECHKLVMTSQAAMRANNSAGAIAQLLRRDIARISQNGLLCISEIDNRPVLMFMTAGPASTLSAAKSKDPMDPTAPHEPFVGTGTLTMIGEMPNTHPDDTGEILWRAAGVFVPTTGSGWFEDAIGGTDFSALQVMSRADMKTQLREWTDHFEENPPELCVPADTISNVKKLWQVVATHCYDVKILWTDGTVDSTTNALEWYGAGQEKGGGTPEDSTANPYFALWTHHNQNNWPKAIKITFTLDDPDAPVDDPDAPVDDPDAPVDYKGMTYEIICPIGQ